MDIALRPGRVRIRYPHSRDRIMTRTTWAFLAAFLAGCTPPPPSAPAPAPTPEEPVVFQPAPRQAGASDWPTILGPTRDGVSPEKGIIAPWPKDGLKKLWECEL